MNIYQRIVLVAGAIAFLMFVYYAPIKDTAGLERPGVPIYIWPQRAVTVVGCTMFIWWALSGIGKKKE
jgi:hypothetical protein